MFTILEEESFFMCLAKFRLEHPDMPWRFRETEALPDSNVYFIFPNENNWDDIVFVLCHPGESKLLVALFPFIKPFDAEEKLPPGQAQIAFMDRSRETLDSIVRRIKSGEDDGRES